MANEFVARRGIISLGGITYPQVTIGSTYTITDDDYMVAVSGGTFTINLPTAVGVQGKLYVIKNNEFLKITYYDCISYMPVFLKRKFPKIQSLKYK